MAPASEASRTATGGAGDAREAAVAVAENSVDFVKRDIESGKILRARKTIDYLKQLLQRYGDKLEKGLSSR